VAGREKARANAGAGVDPAKQKSASNWASKLARKTWIVVCTMSINLLPSPLTRRRRNPLLLDRERAHRPSCISD